MGLLHVFIQHTSASLTINENADPDVPADLETSFSAIAPEDFPYRHTCEGPDDMPAHVKASLLGSSLTIPVANGRVVPGHMAGNLSVRTPQPRRAAEAGADAVGRDETWKRPSLAPIATAVPDGRESNTLPYTVRSKY